MFICKVITFCINPLVANVARRVYTNLEFTVAIHSLRYTQITIKLHHRVKCCKRSHINHNVRKQILKEEKRNSKE